MSASREAPLMISQPTPTFLRLVEKAAHDMHDQTITAEEQLVKLDFTSACEDVQKEYKSSYQDKIQPGSPTAAILDPNKIRSWWKPTPWVMTGGSFHVPEQLSAVAIPLVNHGNPTIQYYDSQRVTWPVDWKVGSVIYLAGGSSLMSDGRGKTAFIFLMFTMNT